MTAQEVERSWSELVGWLEANAPATTAALRRPADAAELEAAQRTTGREP